MIEYKLSPNLELLRLLNPSTTSIDNVAVSNPLVFAVDRPEVLRKGQSFVDYKREIVAQRRANSESSPASGTRGGRKSAAISKEDVLTSLSSVSDLAHYFVYAFTGMIQSATIADYQRQVFGEGLKNDRFVDITFKDFTEVFSAVWYDILTPCVDGMRRRDIGTFSGLARQLKCSKDKAKRLMDCYRDIGHIIMTSMNEVAQALWVSLKRPA